MATPNIVPRAAGEGGLGAAAYGWGGAFITNTTTTSASQGGKLVLAADDGAVMADNHRLGVIEFKGAEDTSNTLSIGARIEAICRDAWDGSNNDADLEFYTTDGTTESKVLTLDADKKAIFPQGKVGIGTTTPLTGTDSTLGLDIENTSASAAGEGGALRLGSNDGAPMGSGHRLGVIEFTGAEDASSTLTVGARIEALSDATWSDTENGADLVFYTTDGNASQTEQMRCTASTGVSIPKRKLAVTSSTDGDANGDIVYFGGTTSMTTGAIYHYKSDGTWELADADNVATCDGLLGVALGAASDTNGVLLRGFVTLDHDPGAIGDVLYVSTTDGDCSATAPSATGDVVRIVGYQVSHASNGNVWFNPSSTFVELT